MHIVIMDPFDPEARAHDGDIATPATLPQSKARFARVFASYCGARVTSAMRLRKLPGEKSTDFGKIIAMHERIQKYTNFDEGTCPQGPELMTFGDQLFRTLFTPPVRRLYDEARTRQRDRKLDLVFTSMVPWIAEKPWEFAYDAARKRFIATEDVNFIRNVLTPIPSDDVQTSERLRILVVAAQPVGFVALSVRQEEEVIRSGFESLERQGLADVDTLPRATPEKLHRRLQTNKYSVVHFIGHGDFDPKTEEGALLFESPDGGSQKVTGADLRKLFCGRGLSLVFLNACLSGSGGRADFNKGVAQSLVEAGLPALVANQYSVLDSSATTFARNFYWSLAHGLPLGQAARESRIAVNYGINGEIIDWAVPVVYARDPNLVLCPRLRARRAAEPDAREQAMKRHKYRIAVWDMDNVFPKLAQILARMNAAQTVYGFELVQMSTPLDIWYLDEKSPEGTPYLWAEKLARRIRSRIASLGVDLLAVATRHWLADDDTLNLYGWWPDKGTPSVMVFSCAGFDRLPVEGPVTDRAIVNATVTGLAGYFGHMGTHDKGAHDCPMFTNELRSPAALTGQQKFDEGCHEVLEKKLGADFAALEKLLGVVRKKK